MNHSRTAIRLFPRRSRFWPAPAEVRSAVSLHSHSRYSRESLRFLPQFARRIPVVARMFELSLARYERQVGRPLDFGEWYWRPLVTPAEVIASERENLQRRLGVAGLVSLTDHDTIEGPLGLRASDLTVPLSVEWTVPFNHTAFHLGVHGIRATQVGEISRALAAYTAGSAANGDRLAELLTWLSEWPETFVVLNHPYWDLGQVGRRRHDATVLAFLRAHAEHIHALELNGYRTWSENRRVLPLAEGFGLPIVGGGDRHGIRPNAIVNLTRAGCFAEFAHEVRIERATQCVVFPEYDEPFTTRVLQSADDFLKPHRSPTSRGETWADRIYSDRGGHEQPLADMWKRAPRWLEVAVAVTRLLGTKGAAALFAITQADGRETLEIDCSADAVIQTVPQFTPDSAAAA